MATSALRTWASSRVGAKKTPEQSIGGILPKEAPKEDKPREKKAKLPPRQWHDDHKAHGLPEQTWKDHYDGDPTEGGRPSKSRKELIHDPIVQRVFHGVKVPKPGDKKLAIMTMGAPASGKSSGLRGVDLKKFVAVDPDDIKTHLPEYQKATSDRTKTFKGAAWMAHEESSDIAKRISKEAIAKGHHVLIDGTGANQKSFLEKMKHLQDNGYHVHVVKSHLDEEEGVRRAKVRADDTGREIPEKIIRHAYKSVPRNFKEVAEKANSFHVVDNRGAGKGGKVVWSKDPHGEEHAHDPHFVRAFKGSHF